MRYRPRDLGPVGHGVRGVAGNGNRDDDVRDAAPRRQTGGGAGQGCESAGPAAAVHVGDCEPGRRDLYDIERPGGRRITRVRDGDVVTAALSSDKGSPGVKLVDGEDGNLTGTGRRTRSRRQGDDEAQRHR